MITDVDPAAGDIAGLVYLNGFAPDAGETAFQLAGMFPGSTLGQTLQTVPLSNGTTDLYIRQERFHAQFCADVPAPQSARMAVTRRPATQEALVEPSGEQPLWKELPSWFLIGEEDRAIPPAPAALHGRACRGAAHDRDPRRLARDHCLAARGDGSADPRCRASTPDPDRHTRRELHMSVMNTQALGAGDHDGRTNDTGLKHERGVHDGPGVPASGRAIGWGTAPRRLGTRRGICPDASAPALKEPRSMNTTTPQLTHVAPQSATPRPTAGRWRGSGSPDRPTWGEVFDERAPLIGAPAFFGPPIIFVLSPWLLLVLLLIGPLALIFTVLLTLAVAAGLLAVLLAVIASPYLLIRHLAAGTVHAKPLAPLHLFRKHRVSSGRLGSPQPKGVS